MKVIISPAKSLNFKQVVPTKEYTKPQFLEKTLKIHKKLQKQSAKSIAKLMNLSDKLGQLNWQRYQDWSATKVEKNARQAIFAFWGDVYLGLDAYSLSKDQISLLQAKVRILSGFYGLLRPLDLIQAHRLTMGTNLKIGKNNNLYQFWGEVITKALAQELQKNEPLINLASNEYFKLLQKQSFASSIITPIFQDCKNGQYKVISFFAKKARGMMVRFLLDHNLQTFTELKNFDYGGYIFTPKLSTADMFVFQRKEL